MVLMSDETNELVVLRRSMTQSEVLLVCSRTVLCFCAGTPWRGLAGVEIWRIVNA